MQPYAMVFGWKGFGRFHARIERLEPPHLLAYRWARTVGTPVDDGPSTLVEFRLRADGDATHVQLVESGFAGCRMAKPITPRTRRVPITRQAIGKHLSTLEDAGLVQWQRVGREVRFEAAPQAMDAAAEWMNQLAREWDARLDRLAAIAEATAARAKHGQ